MFTRLTHDCVRQKAYSWLQTHMLGGCPSSKPAVGRCHDICFKQQQSSHNASMMKQCSQRSNIFCGSILRRPAAQAAHAVWKWICGMTHSRRVCHGIPSSSRQSTEEDNGQIHFRQISEFRPRKAGLSLHWSCDTRPRGPLRLDQRAFLSVIQYGLERATCRGYRACWFHSWSWMPI